MALSADDVVAMLYQHEVERRGKTYDRMATPIAAELLSLGDALLGSLLLVLLLFAFAVLAAFAVVFFASAIAYLRRSIQRYSIETSRGALSERGEEVPYQATFLLRQLEAVDNDEARFATQARHLLARPC